MLDSLGSSKHDPTHYTLARIHVDQDAQVSSEEEIRQSFHEHRWSETPCSYLQMMWGYEWGEGPMRTPPPPPPSFPQVL